VELAHAQAEFHAQLDRLEERPGNDLDAVLLSAAAATPTSDSVRYSLEQFYKKPQERSCPCCGRPGLPEPAMNFAKESLAAAKAGNCIICSKDLGPVTKAKVPANSDAEESTDASALRLQAALFKREQLKSRIEDLSAQAVQAASRLASARASELEFRERNPASSVAPLKVAVETMRSRQRDAESRRSRALRLLRKELASTNDAFASIQSGIAKAFKKYASLYLDETCDVELLSESSLPGRKGPQVKAPHAAFYPVISGQTRPSAQALSDAQRTFVDLALRMAIIDVWHRQTKGVVTLIVETPEGATDLAYMERVANMLGAFSKSGHTIIVTSNLNNQFFLPELMAVHPKGERASRMLNLLDKGRPHSVQEAHKRHFRQILNEVATRRVIS
jgi:hypothetical protein